MNLTGACRALRGDFVVYQRKDAEKKGRVDAPMTGERFPHITEGAVDIIGSAFSTPHHLVSAAY